MTIKATINQDPSPRANGLERRADRELSSYKHNPSLGQMNEAFLKYSPDKWHKASEQIFPDGQSMSDDLTESLLNRVDKETLSDFAGIDGFYKVEQYSYAIDFTTGKDQCIQKKSTKLNNLTPALEELGFEPLIIRSIDGLLPRDFIQQIRNRNFEKPYGINVLYLPAEDFYFRKSKRKGV